MLAGGVTRAFTYSATGNVTVDSLGGTATTLTYNASDRLVRVSAGGVPLVDYVYAATGQRAVKTTPTATTHYLYDPGGALYAETDGAGNVLREYITLGGATIAIVDALGVNYVHDDHLGTPQLMTDGSAAVVWDASYRPFGEATIAGAAANDQRFPGQTADAETGWHDNWHRTYDPSLGRYLQSDPIGIMAGFNTYGYANGNPVMYADPTGEFAWLIPMAAGFVVGAAFDFGFQLAMNGGRLECIVMADIVISGIVGAVTGGTAGPALAKIAPRAGSMIWSNVRGRVQTALRKAGVNLENIQIHHWLIANNGRLAKMAEKIGGEQGRRVFDWLIQRSWNYKPLLDTVHKRIHFFDWTRNLPRFNIAQRWWYGTPGWAKAMQGSVLAGASGKAIGRIFGAGCECEN